VTPTTTRLPSLSDIRGIRITGLVKAMSKGTVLKVTFAVVALAAITPQPSEAQHRFEKRRLLWTPTCYVTFPSSTGPTSYYCGPLPRFQYPNEYCYAGVPSGHSTFWNTGVVVWVPENRAFPYIDCKYP
jgi:hypothetical protein